MYPVKNLHGQKNLQGQKFRRSKNLQGQKSTVSKIYRVKNLQGQTFDNIFVPKLFYDFSVVRLVLEMILYTKSTD